jgi:hypothetical protein
VLGGSRGARRARRQGGKRDQGHGEDDAWKHGKQEVDDGDLHSGGRRGAAPAAEQKSRGAGGRGGSLEEEGREKLWGTVL